MATKLISCRQFTLQAVEENRRWYEDRDVKDGQWASCLWHFVRIFRFEPSFASWDPADVADLIERELCAQLDEEGLDDEVDPWRHHFDFEIDTGSRDAFIKLWHKVRQRTELDDPLELARYGQTKSLNGFTARLTRQRRQWLPPEVHLNRCAPSIASGRGNSSRSSRGAFG